LKLAFILVGVGFRGSIGLVPLSLCRSLMLDMNNFNSYLHPFISPIPRIISSQSTIPCQLFQSSKSPLPSSQPIPPHYMIFLKVYISIIIYFSFIRMELEKVELSQAASIQFISHRNDGQVHWLCAGSFGGVLEGEERPPCPEKD
jgi:hypothetical protein